MDLGTLITLLKIATESGALPKSDVKPVGIADLPIPLFEGEPPPSLPGVDKKCPLGTEKVWSGSEYICKFREPKV